MATRQKIEKGPSKWELVIEGLGNVRPIGITFEKLGRCEVLLKTVGPEDGNPEQWLITGLIRSSRIPGSLDNPLPFNGYFSTKDRQGWYELEPESVSRIEMVKPTLSLNRAQPFDPASFIGSGWTIWCGLADGKGLKGEEQQDARSLALTEIDFTKARFEACLADGEHVITGEQRLNRLREKDVIRADAAIGVALLKEPDQVTLNWLYQTHGVKWFELPGTELRDPSGDRCFLCLCRRDGGRWSWRCSWLGGGRGAGGPALVFAS